MTKLRVYEYAKQKNEVKNNTEEKSDEDAQVEENSLEDEIYNM